MVSTRELRSSFGESDGLAEGEDDGAGEPGDADGEPVGTLPATFTVVPATLPLVVPGP